MPRSRCHGSNASRFSVAAAIQHLERRVLLSSYPVSNLNDAGAGSLRDAIQQANAHAGADTISFAAGLSGTVTLTSGSLSISDDLDLVGPGAGVMSVSGMNASTVFEVGGGGGLGISVAMSGLTITGGYTNSAQTGGGINNHQNARLTIDACAFTHNQGLSAGAIQNGGILDVTDCTFSQNVAVGYAAISDFRGSTSIANSTFSGNTGGVGSGVIVEDYGAMTILNCTITGNTTEGGIKGGECSLAVMNTTISGTMGEGGAIKNYCAMVHFSLVNCTLTGNKVGVNDYEGIATITNCTITGNNLGIEADSEVAFEARVPLTNSIVAKNGTDFMVLNQAVGYVSGSNNLIGDGASVGFVDGQNGNIVGVTDPMLAPLGNYGGPIPTMPPLAGSPAIDAGDNALAVDSNGKPLISDQRGYYRIVNGKADIGSAEFNSTPLVPGDANGDGKVDFSDLLLFARKYGTQTGATWGDGDFTGDGAVNFDDLLVLARNYGRTRLRR